MISWMVSIECEGVMTISFSPGDTEGAIACSTASAAMRSAFSSMAPPVTTSYPPVRACTV